MKRFFFFGSVSLPFWGLCPGLKKRRTEGGSEDDLERRRKTFTFSGLFTPSTNVPHFLLFHSFSPSLASLFLCPSFPLGRQPCALEALRDETTDWSFSRGQKKKKAPEKAWLALQPRHQPATKLDVVKLSNYLRKLQQNLRKQKTEREKGFFSYCIAKNMVFVKELLIFINVIAQAGYYRLQYVVIHDSFSVPFNFLMYIYQMKIRLRLAFFIYVCKVFVVHLKWYQLCWLIQILLPAYAAFHSTCISCKLSNKGICIYYTYLNEFKQ